MKIKIKMKIKMNTNVKKKMKSKGNQELLCFNEACYSKKFAFTLAHK